MAKIIYNSHGEAYMRFGRCLGIGTVLMQKCRED